MLGHSDSGTNVPGGKISLERRLRYKQRHDLSTRNPVQTTGHKEMHDLTDEVARIVNESGVRSGVVHIFNVGSTAAIGTIEFEPASNKTCPLYWTNCFRQAVTTARTRLARRQRPFPFAGDDAGPFAHRAHPGSQTPAGHMAANLSS